MTSELRLGEGEGMSHVETTEVRGGGHCKGADTKAFLVVSGATEDSVARAQGPHGEGEERRSERPQKPYHVVPFLGEETTEILPPLYPLHGEK